MFLNVARFLAYIAICFLVLHLVLDGFLLLRKIKYWNALKDLFDPPPLTHTIWIDGLLILLNSDKSLELEKSKINTHATETDLFSAIQVTRSIIQFLREFQNKNLVMSSLLFKEHRACSQ